MSLTSVSLPTLKYEGKDFAGLVSANHFGNLFNESPIKLSGFLDTVYKVNLQEDILSILNRYPTMEINDDKPFEWELMGADTKNIPLVKATDLAGNEVTPTDTFGKYHERFVLYFEELLFFQTHVIVGEHPDLYQLLVRTSPEQVQGGEWRIEVELLTGNPEDYIPYEDLMPGTRWSVEYSVSEQFMSRKGSDISFTSPFVLSNRISMFRKEHTVPGEMIRKGQNEPVSFNWQVVNENGQAKRLKTWLNRIDFEFDKSCRKEKARLLFYGKGNQSLGKGNGRFGNIGDSKGPIKTGMGIRETISPSNVAYYTTFNIEHFVNFLLDLSIGRIPEKDRHFVIGTGSYGLAMVSRSIERYAGSTALSYGLDNNRINTINKVAGGDNKYSYNKPQFVKHANINGISMEFVLLPWYDDTVRNKLMHPEGGTVESRRLTILDFGTSEGHPNIQLVRIKNQPEVFGYVPGLRDPYSPGGMSMNTATSSGNPKIMASGIDGYEIHRADWVGVRVHNPLRCAEYIPNMLSE